MDKSKIQIFIINLCHYTRFLKRIAKSFNNNVEFGSRDIKNFTSRLKQLKNVFGLISFKDFKFELEIEFTNKIFLGLDISDFSKIEEFKNTDICHLHFANKLFKLYKDAYNEDKFLALYCIINEEEVARIFKAPHYCDDDYMAPAEKNRKTIHLDIHSEYARGFYQMLKTGNKMANLKYIQAEKENNKNMKNGLIKNVYYNNKKGATVVEFWNGDKIRVTRRKEDKHDLEKAIAIAMVKYAYGLDAYLEACDNAIDSTKKPKEKKKTPVKKETSKSTTKEKKHDI